MTDQERQIIRSVLNTLTELVYGMKKEENGITSAKLERLEANEQTLLNLIDRLNH